MDAALIEKIEEALRFFNQKKEAENVQKYQKWRQVVFISKPTQIELTQIEAKIPDKVLQPTFVQTETQTTEAALEPNFVLIEAQIPEEDAIQECTHFDKILEPYFEIADETQKAPDQEEDASTQLARIKNKIPNEDTDKECSPLEQVLEPNSEQSDSYENEQNQEEDA